MAITRQEFDRFVLLFWKREEENGLIEDEHDEYMTLLIKIIRGF